MQQSDFLQEAEMSATCWAYGRKDPLPLISPIIVFDGVYSLLFVNDNHQKNEWSHDFILPHWEKMRLFINDNHQNSMKLANLYFLIEQ